MNYGSLSAGEQTTFDSYVSSNARTLTFTIWIAGMDDVEEYIKRISIDRGVLSPRGRLYLNVGTCSILAVNEDGIFFDNNESNIPHNAEIRIWTGFNGLNVPVFAGVVRSVRPTGINSVELICTDHMGLMNEIMVDGSQLPTNTIKTIAEGFCSTIGVLDNITSTDELAEVLSRPTFDRQTMLLAFSKLCNSVFYTAFFDVDGILQMKEWEYSNLVSWTFEDGNVYGDEVEILAPTDVINHVEVEYRKEFKAIEEDQGSVDTYKERRRDLNLTFINYHEPSSHLVGGTEEEIDYDLEAVKFTAASGSYNIDTAAVMLKQTSASGYIYGKLYSDSGGSPDTLLGTSAAKDAGEITEDWKWVYFTFQAPVSISLSSDYWLAVDVSSVSGTVYARISSATATGTHAYYDSGWSTENNKKMLHMVRGSKAAQRVAEDMVRFYKEPIQRLKIVAPGIPHLSIMDQVFVDIERREIYGGYVIENRRHLIMPDKYITTDILRLA